MTRGTIMITSSADIAKVLGVTITGEFTYESISTDSRSVQPGDLFLAISGEKFDGNNFAKMAYDAGAVAVISSRRIPEIPEGFNIVVPDTLKAFEQLASHRRDLFQGPVVEITGSAGKTSTKEALSSLLQHFGPTFATFGTQNNYYGVPITMNKLDPEVHRYAVIEVAMSDEGWVRRSSSMVRPNVAIVTSVYPNMHIGFFPNAKPEDEPVAHAKAEIFEQTQKDGYAIINVDTHRSDILLEAARSNGIQHILTFGYHGEYSKLLGFNSLDINHTEVDAEINGRTYHYVLSEAGEHKVFASLAALTAVSALGLDVAEAIKYTSELRPFNQRSVFYRLTLPQGGTVLLLDDSYSGWYDAWKMCLSLVDVVPAAQRRRVIAAVGNMVDLGEHMEEEHHKLGKLLNGAPFDQLLAVGKEERVQHLLAEIHNYPAKYYPDVKVVGDYLLEQVLQDGDLLVVKGSHSGSAVDEISKSLLAKCQNEKVN